MSLTTTTHLNFRGDARAALDFYQSVFGGRTTVVTYADAAAASGLTDTPTTADTPNTADATGTADATDPAEGRWVMWGEVVAEDGFRVMAYDVPSGMPWERGRNSFFVSVRGDDTEEIAARWDRLTADAAGSTVLHPLAPAPWAALYGMVRDRFGVVWVLDVVSPR
ncbi:VOC family protein [Streptomyces sp. AC563]|uniref:VOC family protein n=1 Tax=Streptomyces buecherae TaxID=2763006 RepID=UPI00164E3105|nr:VOC family protein [Streptomyces buecherae]MBC3993209.1 VOC family protein [Streptomyces buecherae]